MSRRALWSGLLFSVATAAPLQAQQTEADLVRLIDSLTPLVEQAGVQAEAARRARFAEAQARLATQVGLDTLSIQGMTIVTPVDDAEQARELFTEVWNESFRGFTSRTLEERTFTFQRVTYQVEEIPVEGERAQIVSPPWHSREMAKSRIRAAIGRAIAAELEAGGVGDWAGDNPFSRIDPAGLYREMISARSVAVRRCLGGDLDACTTSLGLSDDEVPFAENYTPEERRDRVIEWAGYDPVRRRLTNTLRWTEASRQELERCAELDTPDACDGFIERAQGAFTPLPQYVNESIVAMALEEGGPSAWTRLLEDPSMSAREALSYASGMSVDDLIAEWREWVVSNRPDVHADLGGSSALSLLWLLLFAAFAARSTRWRFD